MIRYSIILCVINKIQDNIPYIHLIIMKTKPAIKQNFQASKYK